LAREWPVPFLTPIWQWQNRTDTMVASQYRKMSQYPDGRLVSLATCLVQSLRGSRFMTKRNEEPRWGDWILLRPLGEQNSGQGDTFLVYRKSDDDQSECVLKSMKGGGRFHNREARFGSEIAAYEGLDHPNIIRIIAHGRKKNTPYIVTEYCEGGALRKAALVSLSLIDRLRRFREICAGVAYAHQQGVVHRDLKPDNIFLRQDGTPVVGDFGLCFFLDSDDERVTHVEEAVGARWYMAPECEGGRQLDVTAAADVYSLGKVLYWMLTCRIFAREQHRKEEFNINRGPADFQDSTDLSMRLVYQLFDKTIVERVSERLRDAGEVLTEVDAILTRITPRKEALDLAGVPARVHFRPSGSNEVHVVSFRLGSLPTWHSFDPHPAAMLGFAAYGQTLAAWGVITSGELSGSCRVWLRRTRREWERHLLKIDGLPTPLGPNHRSITVNEKGVWFLVGSRPPGDEFATAYVVLMSPDGRSAVHQLAKPAPEPRNWALATGSGDRVAAYFGSSPVSPQNTACRTFVREPASESWHDTAFGTDVPGSLAFDRYGGVHQAVFLPLPAGQHGAFELRYLYKPPTQPWTETIVDSNDLRRAFGATSEQDSLSAPISLDLNGKGQPVILATRRDGRPNSLAIYEKDDVDFKANRIDLQNTATALGLPRWVTFGAKQLLFDEGGTAHVALSSDSGDSNDIVYLALDANWKVIQQRVFPAIAFLGMGIDGSGTVHLAVQL